MVKFRVYRFTSEEMIPWEKLLELPALKGFLTEPTDDYYSEAMQFTELFDDAGKEIYAGDIVRIQDRFETKTSYVSQVYFTPDYGTFVDPHPAHKKLGHTEKRHLRHFCSYGICEETDCDCLIIGNIYSNPDFFKEE